MMVELALQSLPIFSSRLGRWLVERTWNFNSAHIVHPASTGISPSHLVTRRKGFFMSHFSCQTDEVTNQFKRSVILRKLSPSRSEGAPDEGPMQSLLKPSHEHSRTSEGARAHFHSAVLQICKGCRVSRWVWGVGAECMAPSLAFVPLRGTKNCAPDDIPPTSSDQRLYTHVPKA